MNYTPSIRAALETKLASMSGLPSVSWENRPFSPSTGSSFLKPMFILVNRRPAVRGRNPYQLYNGVFSLDVYCPNGKGPGIADGIASNLINEFEATTDILYDMVQAELVTPSEYNLLDEEDRVSVRIDYAEREQGRITDSNWYMVPVSIGWYTYKK